MWFMLLKKYGGGHFGYVTGVGQVRRADTPLFAISKDSFHKGLRAHK